ncbi:carboxylesterase family protein [Lentzea sp. NPDC005914]|uniref:carboxylesterase/lipase family protein n=1 Tax=Lentzea sp. NPDC005914 TaxID=3154572 RepID=UPI0033E677B9
MRRLLTALIALTLTTPVTAHASANDHVRTDKGVVRGTATSTYRLFQGIPYAAPPVRFRFAEPAAPWQGVRDATAPAPRCAQVAGLGTPASTAEDCLYLNVTTPASGHRLPVMVWIHGGNFMTGSGGEYDARAFAARAGVVVVTINYRLGALGFFGYPGLPGSGSFGLDDQQKALSWVRRNAAAFGGNPANVTIFGESAGGMSACGLLTSPRRLFDKAIIQSGACGTLFGGGPTVFAPTWLPRSQVEQNGAALDLGCSSIQCLRSLDVSRFLDGTVVRTFNRPAYGTSVLPHNPVEAIEDGRFHRMPVMIGGTRDEDTLFTSLFNPSPIPDAQYRAELVKRHGPERADALVARYPLDGDGDARPELSATVTDRSWACPAHHEGLLLSAFRYEFADRNAPMFLRLPPFPYKAYHSSELQYLFTYGTTLTPEQRQLSDQMIDAWARFAASGRPGWPRGVVESLAPGQVGPVDFVAQHQCGFWG